MASFNLVIQACRNKEKCYNQRFMHQGIIHKYKRHFPFLAEKSRVVTLGEGSTPLLPLPNLAAYVKRHYKTDLTLYAKYEGMNPTGSFKDRGMTAAISQAVQTDAKAVICASTGNTSASAAAYAAAANLDAYILIPAGKIATGKLAQAVVFGAKIVQIAGNFDDAMQLVKEAAESLPLTLVNSINPYRLQGQKTAAFEIVDVLEDAPDFHCLPVGNAGNISAYWMGYKEYQQLGKMKKLPRMCGYQASKAAPFVKGEPIDSPQTVATAIRIGKPQSWDLAIAAQTESGGHFLSCTDEEIIQAQQLVASSEGIFCEPASAAAIAGLIKDIQNGFISPKSRVVCTLTGNGLKDSNMEHLKPQAHTMKPRLTDLMKVLKLTN